MINLLKSLLLLIRPLNLVICGFTIFLGLWLTSGSVFPSYWVGTVISVLFIFAAGNSINDYYDYKIDKINKPARPVPSGGITRRNVLYFSIFLFMCGCIAGGFINLYCFLAAAACSFLLWIYSSFLKKTCFTGNITVSVLTGAVFIYCGIAAANIRDGIVPALFAFLFHLGREIVKDMEDVEGDISQNLSTLPILYGLKVSKAAASLVFILLIAATIYPYLFMGYSKYYLFVVIAGVDIALLVVIWILWNSDEKKVFRKMSFFLKLDIILGLLSLTLK